MSLLERFTKFGRSKEENSSQNLHDKSRKTRVVILGGSFSGLAAARKLEGHRHIEATVIEPKPFFEYTPGILRALVQPKHSKRLMVPLKKAVGKCKNIRGLATDIKLDDPTDPNRGGTVSGIVTESGKKFVAQFDRLVVCTGSAYNHQIKVPPDQPLCMESRALQLKRQHQELVEAESILIIGGGIVGVELAAEIIERFPSKNVTILTRPHRLLSDLPEKAQKRAHHWLTKRGVKVITGDTLKSSAPIHREEKSKLVVTEKGLHLKADLMFQCTGNLMNWGSLERCPLWSSSPKQLQRGVKVNSMLQVSNFPIISVAGDACSTKHKEGKTAYTAELHGEYIAKCILKDVNNQLVKVPTSITHESFMEHLGINQPSQVVCVSLGKYEGILIFNSLVLCGALLGGRIAALAKYVIELTILMKLRRNLIGIIFWDYIAHPLANFVEKYIFKSLMAPQRNMNIS